MVSPLPILQLKLFWEIRLLCWRLWLTEIISFITKESFEELTHWSSPSPDLSSYFCCRTFHQRPPLFSYHFHHHLDNKAKFLDLRLSRPKPPLYLGLQISFQLIRWIFLLMLPSALTCSLQKDLLLIFFKWWNYACWNLVKMEPISWKAVQTGFHQDPSSCLIIRIAFPSS